MKKFWQEFKAFISKGNIVDLAIAVIIGAAFNKIVSSLVNDIIMPLISLAVGGAAVSDWKWVIKPAEYDANGTLLVAESALRYGTFIQAIIDFMIISLTLFLMFKIFNYSRKKLGELGYAVVNETKKLSKKNKKNKKDEEIETTETTKVVATETPLEEVKEEVVEEPKTEENPTNNDQIMISLLTEIRDSLKAKE